MAANSKIEWTDRTWNPVAGCTWASPGCDRCYAARMTRRLEAMGQDAYSGLTTQKHFNGVVRTLPDKLTDPLGWKKPRRVFVNSMSDLFHKDVPDEFIDRVFDTMWATPQHTYQVLTKRADRLVQYVTERAGRRGFGWTDVDRSPLRPGDAIHLEDLYYRNQCGYAGGDWSCQHPGNSDCGGEGSCGEHDCPIANCVYDRERLAQIGVEGDYEFDDEGLTDSSQWMELHTRPLHAACSNVWLGFSAEDQARYDERMRAFRSLRWTLGPQFVLFASLEPLLGPISTEIPYHAASPSRDWQSLEPHVFKHAGRDYPVPHLNWVIVGGESGPSARPCEVAWIRSLRQQCKSAGVPCFVKQLGAFVVDRNDAGFEAENETWVDGPNAGQPTDPRAWPTPVDVEHNIHGHLERYQGANVRVRLKDKKGGDWDEWPMDLRVREFPEVAHAT